MLLSRVAIATRLKGFFHLSLLPRLAETGGRRGILARPKNLSSDYSSGRSSSYDGNQLGDFREDGTWDARAPRSWGDPAVPESSRWRFVDMLVTARRKNILRPPRDFGARIARSRHAAMFPNREAWRTSGRWIGVPAATSAEWAVKLAGYGSAYDARLQSIGAGPADADVAELVRTIIKGMS